MSKRKGATPDPRQSAFGFFMKPSDAPANPENTEARAEDFDLAIRDAVATTLDAAARRNLGTMTREQVAEAMARRLGRRVSKTQLDQWSAPSQEDRRIPVDALWALGQITGDWRVLHVLVEACGFKALTPQEAMCAEFGALAAVRRNIDQRARALTGDMEALVDGLLHRMKERATP